jgi:hypothetical protein
MRFGASFKFEFILKGKNKSIQKEYDFSSLDEKISKRHTPKLSQFFLSCHLGLVPSKHLD